MNKKKFYLPLSATGYSKSIPVFYGFLSPFCYYGMILLIFLVMLIPVEAKAVGGENSSVEESLLPEQATLYFRKKIRDLCNENKKINISNEAITIFIDFILFQEGLVKDRAFVVEDSPCKYVEGSTISHDRVKEIDAYLSSVFNKGDRLYNDKFYFYSDLRSYPERLVIMSACYLSEKYEIPEDVIPKKDVGCLRKTTIGYDKLLYDIFSFFNYFFKDKGGFSEFGLVFEFAAKFRQEIINSVIDSNVNMITSSLRLNEDNIREHFNTHIDSVFEAKGRDIVSAMFSHYNNEDDRDLELKFGEELEYNCLKPRNVLNVVDVFLQRIKEKNGVKEYDVCNGYFIKSHYEINPSFMVYPFYDAVWFEINCTPYQMSNQTAYDSFQQVIDVVDSMREDNMIDYASGHKHVDVMSATDGDPGILLWMLREIEGNPWLLRAFGLEDDPKWFKTFGDYASDVKPFAIKRLNTLISLYNERQLTQPANAATRCYGGGSDQDKMDRLIQFSAFYSEFIHMTTIQYSGLWYVWDNTIEKFMAMSLLHITGAKKVKKFSTIEFRFFPCPKTVEEIQRINQFLTAWFHYIHQCRKNRIPLDPIPEDSKSSKDYTTEEVREKITAYLEKLGLNPENYRSMIYGEQAVSGQDRG